MRKFKYLVTALAFVTTAEACMLPPLQLARRPFLRQPVVLNSSHISSLSTLAEDMIIITMQGGTEYTWNGTVVQFTEIMNKACK